MYRRKLNVPKNNNKTNAGSLKKKDVLLLVKRKQKIHVDSSMSRSKRISPKNIHNEKASTLICLQDNIYCVKVDCGIRSPLQEFNCKIEYYRRKEDTEMGLSPSISLSRQVYATFVINVNLNNQVRWHVERRYSEFYDVKQKITVLLKGIIRESKSIKLPNRTLFLRQFSFKFLQQRGKGLNECLQDMMYFLKKEMIILDRCITQKINLARKILMQFLGFTVISFNSICTPTSNFKELIIRVQDEDARIKPEHEDAVKTIISRNRGDVHDRVWSTYLLNDNYKQPLETFTKSSLAVIKI